MKPIRKDEQEYLRAYIQDKFRSKRSALESDRELEVEAQSKKNYKKFVSTLKISNMIKQAEKLQKDYDNFVASNGIGRSLIDSVLVIKLLPSHINMGIFPQMSQMTCLHAPHGMPALFVETDKALNFVSPSETALNKATLSAHIVKL